MCIYDATHYTCTGEEIALVERCPLPNHCIPHIRQVLYRSSVCRLCAIAGLEPDAQILLSRSPNHQILAPSPESQHPATADRSRSSTHMPGPETVDEELRSNIAMAGTAATDAERRSGSGTPVTVTVDQEVQEEMLYDVSDVPALADIAEALPKLNLDLVLLQLDDVHGKVTCEKQLRKRKDSAE